MRPRSPYVMRSPIHPPRVGVRAGRQIVPAIPVTLRGDRISLLFRDIPRTDRDVLVLLDWADGSVTELGARVCMIEDDLSLMELEILTIDGEWETFLAFLGEGGDGSCIGDGAAA